MTKIGLRIKGLAIKGTRFLISTGPVNRLVLATGVLKPSDQFNSLAETRTVIADDFW